MLKQIKTELLEKTDGIYVKVTIYNRVMQPIAPSYALTWNTAHNATFSTFMFIHMHPHFCFTVIDVNVLVKSLSRWSSPYQLFYFCIHGTSFLEEKQAYERQTTFEKILMLPAWSLFSYNTAANIPHIRKRIRQFATGDPGFTFLFILVKP